MKKNDKNKLLFALTLIFATSSIGLIAYSTICAFQNNEKDTFKYQTDIRPLYEYFDTQYYRNQGDNSENAIGNGTKSYPYVISTVDQYINFQKLVQLGCFDYDTYFILGADIDFTIKDENGNAITDENGNKQYTIVDPIGTENCPFNSQFDGRGKKLQNLHVSSLNHEDVGMFGYVGSGGYVKNYILETPTITSSASSDNAKIENPLENIYYLGTQDESDPNSYMKKGIINVDDIPIPSYKLNDSNYPNGKIDMSPKTVVGNDVDKTQYTVYYRSANKQIITDDGIVNKPQTTTKFVVHVDAVVTTTILIDNKPMVVTFVADRFAVTIENNAIIKTDGIISLFRRTYDSTTATYTTNDPHYYQDSVLVSTNTDGTVNKRTRILDQVTYVGFVAGHLDGEASYVGVYQGTIIASSKQTISHSSLIGKNKDDNLLNSIDNNYYYQNINFSEIIANSDSFKNYTSDKYYADQTDMSKYDSTNPHDPDYTRLFNSNATDTVLSKIGIQIPNAFRVYNNFGISYRNSVKAKQRIENETDADSPEEEITYSYETINTQGIFLKENATQAMTIKRVGYRPLFMGNFTYFTSAINYSVSNVLWFWAMQEHLAPDGSLLDKILDNLFTNSEKTLYLNIKLTYSVSSCTSNQTTKEGEEAQFVLYTGNFSNKSTVLKDTYNWKTQPDDVEQFAKEDSSCFTFGPETITLKNPSGSGDNAQSTVPVWKLKNITDTIKGEYLGSEEKEIVNGDGTTETVTVDKYDTFDPTICSGHATEEYSKLIQTKNISIIAKSSQTKPIFGSKVVYAPIFALGVENLNTVDTLDKERLDIYQVEILISHDQGNFSYSLNKVDFLYDLNAQYDSSAATWTKWAREESGVKIYFILENLETDESHPNLDTGVVIYYTRRTSFGNKVEATYYVLGDASYAPGNTNGAKIATITNGTTSA